MLLQYSEYIVLAVGVVIAVIAWALKKEHARIEGVEEEVAGLNCRLSKAINEIGKNDVSDREWRKRVQENHKDLKQADEDRRGDTRKIYDKIGALENSTHKEIQLLGELIAGKR